MPWSSDRSDPKPVLAKSWKPAEGKDRCPQARPAVIALGEGQGTFLHVCIAKKACEKHWGQSKRETPAIPTNSEIEAEAAQKRREAAIARERANQERWRTELRPRALRVIASRTAKLPWSRGLVSVLLDELNVDATFTELVGQLRRLPTRRYPHAISVALALRHSWRREDLVKYAKRLGVKLTAKDLSDLTPTEASDANAPEPDAVGAAAASVH